MATTTSKTKRQTSSGLVCAECGRTFSRAAALGAHRQRAHGIAGTSKNARTRTAAAASATQRQAARRANTMARNDNRRTVDHDALLRVLFPSGIPPRQDTIAAVNDWLAEADKLARKA